MLGQILALSCAFTWATAVILFKRSEEVSPHGLNLFKNVLAVVLLCITLALFGDGIDWQRTTEDWLRLIVSGVVGVTIADTLFFMALKRIGPSLLAVVETTYSPVTVLLAVVFLGERLGLTFLVGGSLVVAGLLIVTTDRRLPGPLAAGAMRDRVVGVAVGLLGVVGLGVAVVVAKPALERGDLIEVTLIRVVAGVVAQGLWLLPTRGGRQVLEVFRPSRVWRTLVPAAFLGSYVSTLLWIGGFKWAPASIAAVLNQMATVFIILLARVFLDEPITPRRATGAAIAIAGAITIVVL